MRISEIFREKRPVFSFEFFPPKTDKGAHKLMNTVSDLKMAHAPDFISVTSGAGGSTRDRTIGMVASIQKELGITTMAHQTCIASTRDEIARNMETFAEAGVQNVLALRGDKPKLEPGEDPKPSDFRHATELIDFLAEKKYDIDLGAACYPESHPESPDAEDDLRWTQTKVAGGAGFLITQLFFDNAKYFEFCRRSREAGITVPIVPGIMPITNLAQIERFTKMCGATLPEHLIGRLKRVSDDPALVMAIGIEHAITQCRHLLAEGAPGIHFYTLNKSHATRCVLAAIRY